MHFLRWRKVLSPSLRSSFTCTTKSSAAPTIPSFLLEPAFSFLLLDSLFLVPSSFFLHPAHLGVRSFLAQPRSEAKPGHHKPTPAFTSAFFSWCVLSICRLDLHLKIWEFRYLAFATGGRHVPMRAFHAPVRASFPHLGPLKTRTM